MVMYDLTPTLWYRTYAETAAMKPCVVSLKALAGCLPHGSGIDGNWYIEVFKNGNVKVSSEYHAMSECGGYSHWVPFSFRLMRAKQEGPSYRLGWLGAHYSRGDLIGRLSCPNTGRDCGTADYLFDTVEYALTDGGIKVEWWD